MSLSPQLRQRIDVLRMTCAEVEALIEQQVREYLTLRPVMNDGGVGDDAEDCREITPAPDVCVEEEGGEYLISSADNLPRLRLRVNYLRVLMHAGMPAEVREFAKRSARSAIDLLRNIEHRRECVCRVAEFLVRSQPAFWRMGPEFIKPISMEEAARATGMSRQTVARVVENKLVRTPHGVFELRAFFTEG